MSKRNSLGECVKSSSNHLNQRRNEEEEEENHSKSKSNKIVENNKEKDSSNKLQTKKPSGIQIRLAPLKSSKMTTPLLTCTTSTTTKLKPPSSQSVAAAFNQSDDEEPEEMPPEAKMRMRNIGRNTPTSTGPNSFGKTKHGFCDVKKCSKRYDTCNGGC